MFSPLEGHFNMFPPLKGHISHYHSGCFMHVFECFISVPLSAPLASVSVTVANISLEVDSSD